MTYQVLARKWRPKNFSEVVGQEHVLKALINALDNNRLHHAYLFTGTRGVGKTTLGRILTKSLNCENGISSKPCGVCSACTEIDQGRFVDLLEVDAASRTKVEDTRELLDNVQYTPTRGRYKVYLIDEVHMLSNHSFNALLKTLEEPPPHVKFILATTDPQKLPVTILSRCLKFNLKSISVDQISEQLSRVLNWESVSYDERALTNIARAANGSMRDALSLLDQAIAHGNGRVNDDEVRAMLGTIERDQVEGLLRALIVADGAKILQLIHELAQFGNDFNAVVAEFISLLHTVALIQVVPDVAEESQSVRDLAATVPAEDVQLYYQIALQGRKDLPLVPDLRAGFEMLMVRMLAFKPAEITAVYAANAETPARGKGGSNIAASLPQKKNITSESAPPRGAPRAKLNQSLENNDDWLDIVANLPVVGVARQIATNSVFSGRDGDKLFLQIDSQNAQFAAKGMIERLQQALQQYLGKPIILEVKLGKIETDTPAARDAKLKQARIADAVQQIEADPTVQLLKQTFDAQLDPRSVQLVDN